MHVSASLLSRSLAVAAFACLATVSPGQAQTGGFGGFSGSGVEQSPDEVAPRAPAAGAVEPARVFPGQREERALGLSRGQRRDIQAGLAKLGYDPGLPDGALGRRSRRAIIGFQRDEGLSTTGFWTAEAGRRMAARLGAARAASGSATAAAPRSGATAGGSQAPAASEGPTNGRYVAAKPKDSEWWGTASLSGGTLKLMLKARSATSGNVDTLRCSGGLGADGRFSCYLRRSGWLTRRVKGVFPVLKIDDIGEVGGGVLRFTKQ